MTVAAGALRSRGRRSRRSPLRLLAALASAAVAAAIVLTQADLRVGEAVLARWFVQSVTTGTAAAAGTTVYFGIGTDQVTGLSITALCSTVVFVVPIVALASAMFAITRASARRVTVAALLGIALVVLCNVVRFASAAWAFERYGREGFDIVHRYAGSLFVIAGFIAAVVLTLVVGLRDRTRTPRNRNERIAR